MDILLAIVFVSGVVSVFSNTNWEKYEGSALTRLIEVILLLVMFFALMAL